MEYALALLLFLGLPAGAIYLWLRRIGFFTSPPRPRLTRRELYRRIFRAHFGTPGDD